MAAGAGARVARGVRNVAAGGPIAGEAWPRYSVPGRAELGVTIKSGQHRSFGNNGVTQQARG